MSAYQNRISSVRLVIGFLCGLIPMKIVGQDEVPKPFNGLIETGKNYLAERVMVFSPEEIEKYIKRVEEAAAKNPKWYREYSEAAKPGVPLPYHENLGLTLPEYQEYRALWGKREIKVLEKVGLRLEKRSGKWRVLVGGREGTAISLLRYNDETDSFQSTNGEMERIEDIEASAETLLGEWTGVEWRFDEETGLGRIKENFALGKSGDDKFGYVVYRLQDLSSTGRVLLDRSLILRFPRS